MQFHSSFTQARHAEWTFVQTPDLNVQSVKIGGSARFLFFE
jgi:hypothetical protein